MSEFSNPKHPNGQSFFFIKDKQTADMRAISLRTEDTFDVCLAPLKKVKGAVL